MRVAVLDDIHRAYEASDGIRRLRERAEVRIFTGAFGDPAALSGFDALIDVVVRKYAPLPAASLGQLVSHLQGGAPQWRGDRNAALKRARARLAHTRIDGVDWFSPDDENQLAVALWKRSSRAALGKLRLELA